MKTLNEIEFLHEEGLRVKKYFSSNKKKLVNFENYDDFRDWYFHELYFYNNKCYYCETSIFIIRELLNNNIIQYRKSGNGFRGDNFEIDRINPFDGYNRENCVLSCYYCNNDKSNTFNYQIYKEFIGPSKKETWKQIYKKFKNNEL